ncbi:ABC transporter substrate-binding protein [Halalkalibacter oceani]|uniref:ABC transporter substrate-binding protein n=1 Tax=Halalkalibacter oceani TaxID=1653776 RepID=UPI003392328A
MKKLFLPMFMMMLAIVIAGCSSSSTMDSTDDENSPSDGTDEEQVSGGELRAAIGQQPETLDPHMSTGATVKYVTRHIFEGLLAADSSFQPQPMLAESWEISDDGTIYTFHLREGVEFHNGKEMTAEDVTASMNRWLEQSSVATQIMGEDAYFQEEDDYTVTLHLEEARLTAIDAIASPKQFAGIMPKDVIEAADSTGITDYVGTGPFKFVEWRQDQYIHFEKFDQYQPVDFPADGLAGEKVAIVDDLFFDIVTDSSTQLAGIQTGQYDIAYTLPNDNYEQLLDDPAINTMTDLYGNSFHHFNKKEGIFTDFKMRQAVNAAVSNEEIMLGGWSHPDLYSLNSSYMGESQVWYSEAGADEYDQADPDKAAQLLEEAGYNGEEIVILTNNDSELYNTSVILHEQLSQLGMNVKLDVYDRATYSERRTNSANWDLLAVGLSTVTTPSQHLSLSASWYGWTEDETVHQMLAEIEAVSTLEEGTAIWDDLQAYLWTEYLPGTKHGDYYYYIAARDNVEGVTILEGPILWNTSVNK